jgi:hypothetical protein
MTANVRHEPGAARSSAGDATARLVALSGFGKHMEA